MKQHELFEYILRNDIRVSVEDGQLHVDAEDALVTDDFIASLREHKRQIAARFDDAAPSVTAAGVEEGVLHPLSAAQRRLYFLQVADPGLTAFNLSSALEIDGPLDDQAFIQSIEQALHEQPIYRTRYRVVDGIPYQIVSTSLPSVDRVDFSGRSAEEVLAGTQRLIAELSSAPFDLGSDHPLRVALLRHDENRHVFVLVMHHIATDEWSMHQLVRRIAELYPSRGTAGRAMPVLSYLEYTGWHNARISRGYYDVGLSYWRDHFDGADMILDLPVDQPRGTRRMAGYASRRWDERDARRVEEFCRVRGVGELSLFLAAYAILLERITGKKDLVIGTDTYGREGAAFDATAGFFVNQVGLRVRVDGDIPLGTLVERTEAAVAESRLYWDVPFDLVVDALEIERDLTFGPVFQTKLLYRRSSLDIDLIEGTRVSSVPLIPTPHFDLTFQVVGGQVEAVYDAAILAESTVVRWLELFGKLVVGIVSYPERLADDLLTELIREQLGDVLVGREAAPAVSLSSVWAGGERHSDAIALIDGTRALTYADLCRLAERVAGRLSASGIGAGTTVAVYIERSLEMVVAVLAVLRLGSVLLPIDHDYPAERVAFLLDDSEAAAVITSADGMAQLGHDYVGGVFEIAHLLTAEPTTRALPPHESLVGGPAYHIYTSGSTGMPKGVVVGRDAFENLCNWYVEFARLDVDSAVLLMIPIGFDASLKNIVAPLMVGGTVVLAPSGIFDPIALAESIERHQVTVVNCAPAAFNALLDGAAPFHYATLASLRHVALGGEAPEHERLRPWLQWAGGTVELANIYGPTECTDISLAHKAAAADWLALASMPIGRPIDNARIHMVDANFRPVPWGSIGEIVIAGRGVALGYHNRPGEQAERFVSMEGEEGAAYRSGDFGRLDEHGRVTYLGRRDGQVKIRGRRVELGEVGAALAQVVGGRQISIQLYDRQGKQTIVAFVAGLEGNTSESGILRQLRELLPRHAIPSRIMFIDRLPLTSHGKVDRQALLDLYERSRTEPLVRANEFTASEQAMAEAWRSVLGADIQVTPESSFFSLGGDSIYSIQLVAELEKSGIEFSVADVFGFPTLSEMAIAAEGRTAARTERTPIGRFGLLDHAERMLLPEDAEDAYPLTSMQEGILFHSRMEPGSTVYNDVFSYEVTVPIDFDLLVAAIQDVIDRHEVLRTGFEFLRFKRPLQMVRPRVQADVAIFDIGNEVRASQDSLVDAEVARLRRNGFDLASASLIRFSLMRRSKTSLQFIINAHHAILDGWSMALIQRQIFENYRRMLHGTSDTSVFAQGAYRFADYVASLVDTTLHAESREFWSGYVDDMPSGALPAPLQDRASFQIVTSPVPTDILHAMAELHVSEAVSIKSLFLLAHMRLLAAIGGISSVATALTENGRLETEGGENLIGIFLNVLPIHVSFEGSTWLSLAKALDRDDALRKPHRNHPFVEILNRNRGLALDSLFTYTRFRVIDALKEADWLNVAPGEIHNETNFRLHTIISGDPRETVEARLELNLPVSAAVGRILMDVFMAGLRAIAMKPRGVALAAQDIVLPPAPGTRLRFRGDHDAVAWEKAAVAAVSLRAMRTGRPTEEDGFLVGGDAAAGNGVTELGLDFVDIDSHATSIEAAALYLPQVSDAGAVEISRPDGGWTPMARAHSYREAWGWAPDVSEAGVRLPRWPALGEGWGSAAERVPVPGIEGRPVQLPRDEVAVGVAALAALAGRLSGQSHFACMVCAPVLGIDAPFPIRIALDSKVTSRAFLADVVEQLEVARDVGFLTRVPAHDRSASGLAVLGVGIGPEACSQMRELADLWIDISLDDRGWELVRGLHVGGELASRWPRYLQRLATAFTAQADTAVDGIPLLSTDECGEVLRAAIAEAMPFPVDRSVQAMFRAQAAATPGAEAVRFGDRRLTYEDLYSEASSLARLLRDRGVAAGHVVAVCMERSEKLVSTLVAVLMAGAAYLPIDPSWPDERKRRILEDALPVVTCHDESLHQPERVMPAECVALAVDGPAPLSKAGTFQDLDASSLAYVIYTSGSTGNPKGVLTEHRALVNRLAWMQHAYPIGPGDVVAQKTPFTFDVSVWEFFWPLLNGATVEVAQPGMHRDPRYLLNMLRERCVSVIHFVPSMLAPFLDHLERTGGACPSLRHIICSGEALPAMLVARCQALLPNTRLHNLYGPTEAAIDVSAWDAPPAFGEAIVPIGRPIANMSLYVLDANRQLVPPGVIGELFIGGLGVARGYLNLPDLTAERFVADPFTGGRMYRTGDLCRLLPDGNFEYLGRNDDQVKVRGIRIETSEIEHWLGTHPMVREAAVVARKDEHDVILVGYVALKKKDDGESEATGASLVDDWARLYDDRYGEAPAPAFGENFVTWTSSFDGTPISVEHMREWRDLTVQRILSLRPTRVLEIGVGTGLLLAGIAPHCVVYAGTDISRVVLSQLERDAATAGLSHLDLRHAEARDFSMWEGSRFDVVVLNSVAQYFPSVEYLVDVIEGALGVLDDGGAIFIGDVRNLALAEHLAAAVEFAQARGDVQPDEFKARIQRRLRRERELLLDPDLFGALAEVFPSIAGVDVRLKPGAYDNELSRYRYDVVIWKGPHEPLSMEDLPRVEWGGDIRDIAVEAVKRRAEGLRVTNVPNPRLTTTPFDGLGLMDSSGAVAPSLADWQDLGRDHGFEVVTTWCQDGHVGSIDVLLIADMPPRIADTCLLSSMGSSPRSLASEPSLVADQGSLLGDIRDHLTRTMPGYMVPSHLIEVDALPITANGKLDRSSLPDPSVGGAARSPARPPQGELQLYVAKLWCELLGIAQPGADDNFFDLGGHSLSAVRLVARIEHERGWRVPLQTVFSAPDLASFADALLIASVEAGMAMDVVAPDGGGEVSA